MQTPGQDFFRALLRAFKAQVRPGYAEMGVKLTWDLENGELTGTFTIPIQTAIDAASGQYIITAQDFLSDPVTTTSSNNS